MLKIVLEAEVTSGERAKPLEQIMEQSVACLRHRLDVKDRQRRSFFSGVLELLGINLSAYGVKREGKNKITVIIGADAGVKELPSGLLRPGQLSFHQTIFVPSGGLKTPSVADLLKNPTGAPSIKEPVAPPGYKVVYSKRQKQFYVIAKEPIVNGTDLINSQPGFDQHSHEPILTFRLDPEGAKKFGQFTKENIGKPFAILMDGKVLTAPIIREPILGGSGQISGDFTVAEVDEYAFLLRTCPLPVRLNVVAKSTL